MAINIFSGGASRGSSAPKSASQQGTRSTTLPVTDGKAGLNKVTGIIGKVGSIAEKYGNLIPGVGGIVSTIGKVMSKNDPEWWMHVPGTGVSTNIPLSARRDLTELAPSYEGGLEASSVNLRPACLEFISSRALPAGAVVTGDAVDMGMVFDPQLDMISTYLMQNVRKVVNAIPLQRTEAYRDILVNQANAYALKHTLDKLIYLAQNSKPFIPAMTDNSYPILAPANYAQMVGLRDRLAEYCKASVRLPHTLCQYLAWRFGRIYRTGTSDKCAIVLYNPIPLDAPLTSWIGCVNMILGFAADPALSYYGDEYQGSEKTAAQADLYNAYLHHITDVQVAPDTQFTYDPKEFVLRTNLDVGDAKSNSVFGLRTTDNVYMDSALDNKTTFMASTVSTHGRSSNSAYPDLEWPLFPVRAVRAHISGVTSEMVAFCGGYLVSDTNYDSGSVYRPALEATNGSWTILDITFAIARNFTLTYTESQGTALGDWIMIDGGEYDTLVANIMAYLSACVMACKALEYYNAEIYIPRVTRELNSYDSEFHIGLAGAIPLDVTAMSQDLAVVSSDIIQNTQVYAFANLVTLDVTSYAAKETPAAIKETHNTLKEVVDTVTPAGVVPI